MQILIALTLAAAQQAAPPPENDVTVTAPTETRVCRAAGPDRSSATRISRRRICLTPTQWRQRNESNVEEAADTLDMISPKIETPGHRPAPR
jgi:hypothetical protein